MFKKFRIQIDEDPIFLVRWRNFIGSFDLGVITYGPVNESLIEYNAYLLEQSYDNDKYAVLTFRDCEGHTLFMLRWS